MNGSPTDRRAFLARLGVGLALAGSSALSACGDGQSPPDTWPVIQPPPPDPLADWYRGGFAGKRVAFWGNSTVSNAVYFFDQLRTHTVAGGLLSGLDPSLVLNYGSNGASLAALMNGQGSYPVSVLIAEKPDLIVIRGPLINDVRLGATTLNAATRLLASALDRIRAGTPTSAILLTTENSLLTTDVGGAGYVQPVGAAQGYTDILHGAVMAQSSRSDVRVLDVMELEYGTECVAQSPLMGDQLHPNEVGQRTEANLIASVIGRP